MFKEFRIIIITVLLIFGLGCNTNVKDNSRTKPNIILVITDDQGYGDLSCHGSPEVVTPNLDKLYEQSLRFTDFPASPTCAPTQSAIMTGKAPFKNGITHTIFERERMALENITLAQELKSLGYTTGIFGKWHLGDELAYQPGQRGFDETFIHGAGGIGQKYLGSCADAPGNKYFDPAIKHNGNFVRTKGFCTNIFFQQAMGWIKKQSKSEEPFFAYIATNAPHSPYIAPEEYKKKFIDAGYGEAAQGFYAMVENIDDNIGVLMKKLEEWKLEENTVLIFMSDNGKAIFRNHEPLRPIGIPDTYNAGMKGYKGSVYEGGTRVPIFMCWPGNIKPNTDIPVLASHFDLFPTLIDIAGGNIPNGIDGKSLLPLIKDENSTWEDRYRFFHKGRWKPGENPDDYRYKNFAIRNERFRLINNEELYDVEADPGEKNNVIKEYPEVVAKMMEAYEEWWSEVRPLLVNEYANYEGEEPPFIQEYNKQEEEREIPDWIPPEL